MAVSRKHDLVFHLSGHNLGQSLSNIAYDQDSFTLVSLAVLLKMELQKQESQQRLTT